MFLIIIVCLLTKIASPTIGGKPVLGFSSGILRSQSILPSGPLFPPPLAPLPRSPPSSPPSSPSSAGSLSVGYGGKGQVDFENGVYFNELMENMKWDVLSGTVTMMRPTSLFSSEPTQEMYDTIVLPDYSVVLFKMHRETMAIRMGEVVGYY